MRTRRIGTVVAAAVLATGAATAPADASTAFHSGTLAYTCTFPGPSAEPATITEDFTGPDTVAPGATFIPTNLSGRITLSDSALAALTDAGYDGVDRGVSAMTLLATNATHGTTGGTARVDPATWVPGSATIDFHGGGGMSWTAGSSGVITFHRPQWLYLYLSLHRQAGNSGTTAWNPTCTLADGQDTAFTPSLPIG